MLLPWGLMIEPAKLVEESRCGGVEEEGGRD